MKIFETFSLLANYINMNHTKFDFTLSSWKMSIKLGTFFLVTFTHFVRY